MQPLNEMIVRMKIDETLHKQLLNFQRPEWDNASLLEYYKFQIGALRKALPYLSERKYPNHLSALINEKSFLGDLSNPNHVFNHSDILWGFHLTEPQVTKGWEYFLSNANVPPKSKTRAELFIQSLCEISGIKPPQCIAQQDIRVKAEVPLRKQQIDLLFEWSSSNGNTNKLAIEFKIGHESPTGQLSGMRRTLKAQRHDELFLFFVVPEFKKNNAKVANRNKDWKPVTWFALLKKFEHIIPEKIDDDDFRRFRRSVWQLTTGI